MSVFGGYKIEVCFKERKKEGEKEKKKKLKNPEKKQNAKNNLLALKTYIGLFLKLR